MAMGAKTGKKPIFEKTQIFRSKNTPDLREKHLRQKRLFLRKKKKNWDGVDPPIFFKKYVFLYAHSKKRIFKKNNFWGVGPYLDL